MTTTARRFLLAALAALALATLHRDAGAEVDRHERISVKPMSKAGKPIGFKLKLVLRPESYQTVRIGLGRMTATEEAKKHQNKDSKLRRLAAGEDPGYLRLQFPEITGLVKNQPKELEFEIKFGEGNDLKPGDEVDVLTAWHGGSSTMTYEGKSVQYWHIFGMHDGPVNQGDKNTVIKLPSEKEEPKEPPK